MIRRELVIIGAGPAGMAAAASAYAAGVKDILLLERDQFLGGILNQCIHTGFGINYFKEILTGPEYAGRFIEKIRAIPSLEVSLRSFVVSMNSRLQVSYIRPEALVTVQAGAVILATGCREKTREMIHIPGTRPAGVFSAGLAQKLINIEGLLPGREAVILGSGDIGLIMARRLTLEGARVKAVIEIQKTSRGLRRNIVQCVQDFDIPLYFQHRISRIHGRDRVEKVTVTRVDEQYRDVPGSSFEIGCDTVLVSVGLIPENELLEMTGAAIDPLTNSPVSDAVNRTSVPGVFVCGNAFKVYDLADWVSVDSEECGRMAAAYLSQVGKSA